MKTITLSLLILFLGNMAAAQEQPVEASEITTAEQLMDFQDSYDTALKATEQMSSCEMAVSDMNFRYGSVDSAKICNGGSRGQ